MIVVLPPYISLLFHSTPNINNCRCHKPLTFHCCYPTIIYIIVDPNPPPPHIYHCCCPTPSTNINNYYIDNPTPNLSLLCHLHIIVVPRSQLPCISGLVPHPSIPTIIIVPLPNPLSLLSHLQVKDLTNENNEPEPHHCGHQQITLCPENKDKCI